MSSNPSEDFWQARAAAFLQSVRPVLRWAREAKGFTPTQADLPDVVSLRGIAAIAQERQLPAPRLPGAGFVDLSDMPDALARPLLCYLGEIGGYDSALPYERQASTEAEKQHGYVLFTARHTLSECLA